MTEAAGAAALSAGLIAVLALSRAPGRRILLGIAAAVLALAASVGPIEASASSLLSAHMLQHVLVGDLVPLLVVLALRGDVLASLPRPPRRVLLGLDRLFRPVPAFALWSAALALWHLPVLYDAALRVPLLHASEHASFALGGLLVWTMLLDPARGGALPGWRRFGYALAVLATSQALANVLVLSYRPIYGVYAARPHALRDQDAAGVVMMVEQLLTVGTFLVLTAWRLLDLREAGSDARHPFTA